MIKKLLATAMIFGLAACGGGGEYEHRMFSTFDATQSDQPGFTSTTSPPALNAQDSVRDQLRGKGDLAFQIPGAKDGNFVKYLPHLEEVAKHRDRFKWIYVFDEMFYSPQRGVEIGALEEQITEAALTVQWYGFKSAVSMMPDVILHPDFRMRNFKAFDVIAIDVYPSNITTDFGCNYYPSNPTANLLACSYYKLREMGYTGEIWYMYQAFGVPSDPKLRENLAMQRETIQNAPSIGINGLISFGYDMYPEYEAPLFGLKGTEYDALVSCAEWCLPQTIPTNR
jgi:hypothetical protein